MRTDRFLHCTKYSFCRISFGNNSIKIHFLYKEKLIQRISLSSEKFTARCDGMKPAFLQKSLFNPVIKITKQGSSFIIKLENVFKYATDFRVTSL